MTTTTHSLKAHAAFLHRITAEGGQTQYFVGFFLDRKNSGDILPHVLLEEIAALRIDLVLDIYGMDGVSARQ